MAISFRDYIDITSGVGAGTVVPTRELIGRLFTANTLLPSNTILEFTSAEEVGNYFGTATEEYRRAVFYFSRISKNIIKAKKISYARWVDEDTAPMIFGARLVATLATFTAISNGSFTLVMGATSHNIPALDFSAAVSLAGVAAIIQTGIRAQSGTQWTAATVTYDSTRGAFNFVGGDDTVNAVISVSAGTTGTNIATTMGWFPEAILGTAGAIWSNGQLAQTVTDILIQSSAQSDNFGTFIFLPTLTIDEIIEAATWNYAEDIKYIYTVPVPDQGTADTYEMALSGLGGTDITVRPANKPNEYPDQCCMMILAATDYTQANATQNYMFQQFALTPSVSDTATSRAYNNLHVNYYGQTQTAGRTLAFYQRGFLQGPDTSPLDMNTYANEMWFKDAAGAQLMTLFLTLNKISANAQGRAQILTSLQTIINQALVNGTISLNGVLTDIQKAYIAEVTNDPKAWYQVQNAGYWISCSIVPYEEDEIIQYKATYTLVYKKDDVVRKVEGQEILI